MLGSNFSRIFFRQSSCKIYEFKSYFPECKLPRRMKSCLYGTCNKKLISSLSLNPLCRNSSNRGHFLTCKRFLRQAAIIEESESSKSYSQELTDRKKQAQRSVLMQISNIIDVPYALALCEKYGSIANAFSYSGENNNCVLLLEFYDETTVRNLISDNYQFKSNVWPIYSRILQFEKKLDNEPPKVNVHLIEDSIQASSLKEGSSISDLIEEIYSMEKLSELDTRLRFFLCSFMKDAISGAFPHCDFLPFGSSVNGIGKHGCDLDVMIRLLPDQDKNDGPISFTCKTAIGDDKALQQKAVYGLGGFIGTFLPGFSYVNKILHARVPILKLTNKILKIDCDVSINNTSAVLMSEAIHFCGEIDPRVRPLLYAVKKWAKESMITFKDPGSHITNFGLTNLVLFFLQNRPAPILPPFNDAFVIIGEEGNTDYRLQFLKSIKELQTCASLNEESLAVLFKEFLLFLGSYRFKECAISLMTGKTMARKDGYALWIQYLFQENLNITKNVSDFDCQDMCEKAKHSGNCLENNLNQKVSHYKDFGLVLGVAANCRKVEPLRSQKIDVNSLFDGHNKNSKNKVIRHRTF